MTPFKAGLKYGSYTGLVLIVIGLIFYLAGFVDYSNPDGPQKYTQWINYILIGVGIILAMKYFKSENEGLMSYGQGVGTGTLTALVIGIISLVWILIFFYAIDPGAIDEIRQAAMDKAMENENMTEEALEQASGIMNMFTSPPAIGIMAAIFTTFIGLVISLIASAFMKQD